MNKRIAYTIIFFATFISLFLSCSDSYGQDEEIQNEVKMAAQKELLLFLERIPNGMEYEYGFNKREDFTRAKLLKPFNLIFPSADYYANEKVDTSKMNIMSSRYWKIPVSIDGVMCCFLQGKFIEDKFKVFGIGGKLTAQMLNQLTKNTFKYSDMKRSIMLFPKAKRQYLIFYTNSINDKDNRCISLNKHLNLDSMKEQCLLEALCFSKSKNNSFIQNFKDYEN
jgi:hypothetical protein